MTYISDSLPADLRAGSAAVWLDATSTQLEGDQTGADLASFNIIRIMRSTVGRVCPGLQRGKALLPRGVGCPNLQASPPTPPKIARTFI